MSLLSIRRALEGALNSITPSIPCAYENTRYTPTAGTAYQACFLLPAEPGNTEFGPNYTQEGLLQVNLFYPADGSGPATATTRAEAIRTAFYRGRALTSGGIVTTITRTPEIAPAFADGDRIVVPVRIRWFASLTA